LNFNFADIYNHTKFKSFAIILFSFISLLTLFIINPGDTNIYIFCPFHLITGLSCPGCGGLRGIHYLLNGNIREALNYNLLLIIIVPAGGYFLLSNLKILLTGKSLPEIPFNKSFFLIILFIVIAYWILRNIIVIRF